MWWKRLTQLASGGMHKDVRVVLLSALLSVTVIGAGLFGLVRALPAHGAPQVAIAADASCAALARADQTATNGSSWGRTILSGHNAYGGWFGVDVCGNGWNGVAPNAANVSCDAIPKNWDKTGCAPGGATSDGYGLTFQCVELVARFSAWAYGDRPGGWVGDAPDLWLPGNHPADFVIYPNGSSHAPVPGDILVYGSLDAHGNPWPAGPDGEHGGHTAVVAAVHGGVIATAEQNVMWGSDDHPSDTLALTHVGSRWIVSGSSVPQSQLPTYRWRGTMGTARATYGWLHSVRNNGRFPANKQTVTSVPKMPGTAPRQTSGGLPSLAGAPVVTDSGGLADLVWTTTSLFESASQDGSAHAAARSLGAPSTARLIVGQTPATVSLPDGTRYSYVVGADGHLYVARTAPRTLGVYWYDHGAPPAVMLEPFLSATRFAGGMAVAAMGSDGNLWWRAGPDGQLGDWMPIGRPANAGLTGSFAIAGAPGVGTPLVLALGQDGVLYERVWQNALFDDEGNVTVPAGWSDWIALAAQQNGPRLAGKLVVVSETQGTHSLIGSWADTPLDAFALDAQGNLVWLRMQALQSGWTLWSVAAPAPLTELVAGCSVAADVGGASGAPLLQVYATGVHGLFEAAVPAATRVGQSVQPVWTALPAAPASAAVTGALALAIGPATSVLVAPNGDQIVAGGPALGTASLAASAGEALPAAGQAQDAWVQLGTAVNPLAFSDPLRASVLSAHWYTEDAAAHATPSAKGVQLVSASGTAALMQGAPSGDATITVQVALPAHAGPGIRAGLVLYLDEGDWLTLLVDGKGEVTFCGTSLQQTVPCVSAAAPQRASDGSIELRIDRVQTAYSFEVSSDGIAWNTLSTWNPLLVDAGSAESTVNGAASPSASPTARPTASPTATATAATGAAGADSTTGAPAVKVAPLAYTECGLYVAGSTDPGLAPTFSDFVVSSGSGPAANAAG